MLFIDQSQTWFIFKFRNNKQKPYYSIFPCDSCGGGTIWSTIGVVPTMVTLPCMSDVTVSVDGQPRGNNRSWANDDGAWIRNVVAPRFHFICDFRDVDARICAEISFICAVETGRSEVKSDRSVEKCVLDFLPDFLANKRHPVGALIREARFVFFRKNWCIFSALWWCNCALIIKEIWRFFKKRWTSFQTSNIRRVLLDY